jgi:hypothetical protein
MEASCRRTPFRTVDLSLVVLQSLPVPFHNMKWEFETILSSSFVAPVEMPLCFLDRERIE